MIEIKNVSKTFKVDGKDFEEEVEEMMVYIKDETSKISRFAFTN